MIKNINEIKRDNIRIRANKQGVWLEVREIHWPSPGEPVMHWQPVKELCVVPFYTAIEPPATLGWTSRPCCAVSALEIEKAINQLLNNRRYFRICGQCRRLQAKRDMYDESACRRCSTDKIDNDGNVF